MNWKQIYTSSTPDEQLELLLRMMETIEARESRVVFTGNYFVRERRRGYQAHFINDRRGRHTIARRVSLSTFMVVLVAVSIVTYAIVINVPMQLGMPMLFFNLTSLLGVLAFKPYKRFKTSPAR